VHDTDTRLWHLWLRINRVLRVMLQTRWHAEAWAQVRVEFRKALAQRSEGAATWTAASRATASGSALVRVVAFG
jgi:hypothetical protein